MDEAPPSPPRSRLFSALGGVALGLSLAVAGAVFCWLMWRTYGKAREMDHWLDVPCEIVEARVEERIEVPNTPVSYVPRVVFRYEADGSIREGDRIKRVAPRSAHRQKMEELIAPFPPGSSAVCHVDPADADNAVLIRDGKYPIYSIWFPALFVVGGLGVAVSSIVRNVRRS